VEWLPSGWRPVLRYRGASLALVFLPQRVVGDAALGYLIPLALREAVDSGLAAGVGGALALGSCAGCALPLLAAVPGTLGGAGLGVAAAPTVAGGTYLLETAAYVLAMVVLTGRPTVRR
jgi:hypothetical protein